MKKLKTLIINDTDFNQKNICIITGTGSGIGKATAIAAAENGLSVIGFDNNYESNQETSRIIRNSGRYMIAMHTDLSQDTSVKAAIMIVALMGKIKYLINIAGIQHIDPIEDFPMEMYDKMQSIMLRAPFLLSKLCIPYMQKDGGVIANMASIHAHICTKNKSVYNICKFGLRALSQSISAEGEGKIRSFTVSTGFVSTPLAMNQIPAQAKQRGITEEEVVTDVMLGKSQIKEMMSPEEVADLIMFGISRHGKYLVGGDLLVDGGVVKTY